jgi:hypothetical protein
MSTRVCAFVVACGCDGQVPWSEAASLEAGCGVVPRPRVLQPHGCCTSWPRCGWKHQVRNVHSVSATALLGKDNSVSSGLLHTWHLKMSSCARVIVRCCIVSSCAHVPSVVHPMAETTGRLYLHRARLQRYQPSPLVSACTSPLCLCGGLADQCPSMPPCAFHGCCCRHHTWSSYLRLPR